VSKISKSLQKPCITFFLNEEGDAGNRGLKFVYL